MAYANGQATHVPAQGGGRTGRTILRTSSFAREEWTRIQVTTDAPTSDQGASGDPQYRYDLDYPANGILYASLALHEAIQALPPEVTNIGLLKVMKGRRDEWTATEWRDEEPPQRFAPPPPSQPIRQPAPVPHTSPAQMAADSRAIAAIRTAPQPAATQAIYPDAAEMAEAAQPPRSSQRTDTEIRLWRCWRTAIDMAAAACEYAKEHKGILLTPAFEDIRAMAATLLIQEGKS